MCCTIPPFTAAGKHSVRDTKIEKCNPMALRQLSAFLAPQESRGVKVLGPPAGAPLARLSASIVSSFC